MITPRKSRLATGLVATAAAAVVVLGAFPALPALPALPAVGFQRVADSPASLVVTTNWLADAVVGAAYTVPLAELGGAPPVSWSISSGSLPAGLHLVASTGAITGTPDSTGTSSFSVEATDELGAHASAPLSLVVNSPSGYTPVTPARLFDTRNDTGGTAGGTAGPVGAGATLAIQVTGTDGIPQGATAVALNVTAVDATAPSTYLTVWPGGTAEPATSTLNVHGPGSVADFAVVAIGADGSVDFSNYAGTVDLLADVSGYFSPTGADTYQALPPQRLFDTRDGTGGVPIAPLGPGASRTVAVRGADGIPADAAAVALNLTAVGATAPSTYVTAWPSGSARPTTSSLNVQGSQPVANFAFVPVGTGGKITVFNWAGRVDVLADVAGYFVPTVGQDFTPIAPDRLFDTRNGTGGVPVTPVASSRPLVVTVAGTAGVPPDATAVALTMTAVDATAPAAYLTAWPDGAPQPLASSLNVHSPGSEANADLVQLGADGKIDVAVSSGSVDVLADVAGYVGDPDGAARQVLSGAGTAARAVFQRGATFGTSPDGAAASLGAALPAASFSTGAVSAGIAGDVSLELSADSTVLVLANQAADGTCWYEEDNEENTATNDGLANASPDQGVSYATTAPTTETSCSAADLNLAWGSAWTGISLGDGIQGAQSDLTIGITSAKTVYTNGGSSYGTWVEAIAALTAAEPELIFSPTGVTSPPRPSISVEVSADEQVLVLAEHSASDTCWYEEYNEENTATNDGLANASPDPGLSYATTAPTTETRCSATDPGLAWGSAWTGIPLGIGDQNAQADLTNGIWSAQVIYTNTSSSFGTMAEAVVNLSLAEPELSFTTLAVTSPSAPALSLVVSADGQILVLAGQSLTGTCWYVEDNEEVTITNDGISGATPTLGVSYASSAGQVEPSCRAYDAPDNWGASFPPS